MSRFFMVHCVHTHK